MSDPFIAEIRIFASNFAPRNWAFCNGQLLPISQNTALFSLIGTTYGGDGRTRTALPNLQGRAPMHPGQGPGLTSRRLGQISGTTTVTLTEAQMPHHTHAVQAMAEPASLFSPNADASVLARSVGGNAYATDSNATPLDPQTIGDVGVSQAHENRQPYIAMHFIIALRGVYPNRG